MRARTGCNRSGTSRSARPAGPTAFAIVLVFSLAVPAVAWARTARRGGPTAGEREASAAATGTRRARAGQRLVGGRVRLAAWRGGPAALAWANDADLAALRPVDAVRLANARRLTARGRTRVLTDYLEVNRASLSPADAAVVIDALLDPDQRRDAALAYVRAHRDDPRIARLVTRYLPPSIALGSYADTLHPLDVAAALEDAPEPRRAELAAAYLTRMGAEPGGLPGAGFQLVARAAGVDGAGSNRLLDAYQLSRNTRTGAPVDELEDMRLRPLGPDGDPPAPTEADGEGFVARLARGRPGASEVRVWDVRVDGRYATVNGSLVAPDLRAPVFAYLEWVQSHDELGRWQLVGGSIGGRPRLRVKPEPTAQPGAYPADGLR